VMQYFNNINKDNSITTPDKINQEDKTNNLISYEDYRRSCDIIKNSLDNIGQRIDANKFYALSPFCRKRI